MFYDERCSEDTPEYEACARCGDEIFIDVGCMPNVLEGEITCSSCMKLWYQVETGNESGRYEN